MAILLGKQGLLCDNRKVLPDTLAKAEILTFLKSISVNAISVKKKIDPYANQWGKYLTKCKGSINQSQYMLVEKGCKCISIGRTRTYVTNGSCLLRCFIFKFRIL